MLSFNFCVIPIQEMFLSTRVVYRLLLTRILFSGYAASISTAGNVLFYKPNSFFKTCRDMDPSYCEICLLMPSSFASMSKFV